MLCKTCRRSDLSGDGLCSGQENMCERIVKGVRYANADCGSMHSETQRDRQPMDGLADAGVCLLDLECTPTFNLSDMTANLTIQQVAAATGLSVHTLRYYERIGLIDPVPRAGNSHRRYRAEDLRWIEFLLRLRSTGLPVRQMLRYAELRRQGDGRDSVSERKALLARHARKLEGELVNLQETLSILHDKVALYSGMEAAMQAGPDRNEAKGASNGKRSIREGAEKTRRG